MRYEQYMRALTGQSYAQRLMERESNDLDALSKKSVDVRKNKKTKKVKETCGKRIHDLFPVK